METKTIRIILLIVGLLIIACGAIGFFIFRDIFDTESNIAFIIGGIITIIISRYIK